MIVQATVCKCDWHHCDWHNKCVNIGWKIQTKCAKTFRVPKRLCLSDGMKGCSMSSTITRYVCLCECEGMLALEMLGRRAHNDHPNNFSRSPPYTEDVKWLLGLAARLGETWRIMMEEAEIYSKLNHFFIHTSPVFVSVSFLLCLFIHLCLCPLIRSELRVPVLCGGS